MAVEKSKAFYFCCESPPDQFYKSVEEINLLNSQQYSELLGHVFVFLGNLDLTDELNVLLNSFAKENRITIDQVKDMFKTLLIVAKEASTSKLSTGQLFSDLQLLKLDVNRASQFCQTWKKSVDQESVKADLKNLTHRLVDMEWKFGVTASSSELHRVGTCYIQLKLVVSKEGTTENILLELTLPQFYDFMHEMEKAKLQMDSMV